jgi:hypothetical protein
MTLRRRHELAFVSIICCIICVGLGVVYALSPHGHNNAKECPGLVGAPLLLSDPNAK